MRPTFMGFESAKSAVFTNQKALDITGNNLANAETRGYTRQRVDRASVAPSTYGSRVASSGGRIGLAGQGVEAMGAAQTRDSFLDKRFRDEYSKASYHGQTANILSDIQAALGDGKDITDESGLYGAITGLYKSLDDFVKNPTTDTDANLVMSAFKNMAQVLQQMDAKLTNVANQHIEDLRVTTSRTNELLQQIAHYNKMISEDAVVMTDPNNEYFRPNELMDQRNLLLDELASYGDINVTSLSNGAVNVSMNGHKVVTENQYESIAIAVSNAGSRDQTVALQWRSTGKDIKLTGGSLLASVEVINGRGHNVQNNTESAVQGVLYYRDRIDTFAHAMTQMVNNSIPEMDTATGEPKLDPITGQVVYKTLLAAKGADGKTSSGVPLNAGNITVSDEWKDNGAGYFIYGKDRRVIKYAQQIALNLNQGSYNFDSFGEKFTGSFAEYEVDFIGRLGSDLAFSTGRQEATGMVADDFLDRRDSISGVNRDEETSDMLRFQKSYEAAARLMTTLDDLLDIVINRMGRVGL